LPLLLALGLTACVTDPPTGSAPAEAVASGPRRVSIHLQVALPKEGGAIDSAKVRVRGSAGAERIIPMEVSDSLLETDVADLEPGATEFAVSAYGNGGTLAFYGEATWDPAETDAASTISLGRVGRIRVDGDFHGGRID
jgi:hypothetical protein